ncbi:unnamed protein product [Cuscuta europaea]|uniref:Uncharacterized protein n=1 Tax=Cuscuta europaea TaxID=41803 RepID=A0A9P1EBT9_CUSEU|nr:unnamed protein product [Cuscuta europaea]
MNPEYYHWLKLDQTVRFWLFATLSRDILVEVHQLKNSTAIWERLEARFMAASLARSMELKHMLSHMKKKDNQSMDQYLLEIRKIVESLASINSPVSDHDLLQTALLGLCPGYESLVGPLTLFPEGLTFDKLCTKLVHQEARLHYQQRLETTVGAPAFAAHGQLPAGTGQQQPQQASAAQQQQNGQRGSHSRGRGSRGRGRGRGGQYLQQQYPGGHQYYYRNGQQPHQPYGTHGRGLLPSPPMYIPGTVNCNSVESLFYILHHILFVLTMLL